MVFQIKRNLNFKRTCRRESLYEILSTDRDRAEKCPNAEEPKAKKNLYIAKKFNRIEYTKKETHFL
jgi:hypothetical protein